MTGPRRDGRAPATPSAGPGAPPDGPPDAGRGPGRHSSEALGSGAIPVSVLTARRLLVPDPQADPSSEVKVCAAEVGIRRSTSGSSRSAGFDGFEIYAAASLARRSARDTVVRLTLCRDRAHLAARTVASDAVGGPGMASSEATALAASAGRWIGAIEQAERKLADALDALDAAKVVVGEADRALRRFHPHGGTLVVTLPTRRRAQARLAAAVSVANTRHHIADNATYALVKEIVVGERAVRAIDRVVGYLLDHGPFGATAPPVFLRLIRAALPPSHQLDWWRELCSLFAECRPDERRVQATSQAVNAARTIWTAWAVARTQAATAPHTEDETHREGVRERR